MNSKSVKVFVLAGVIAGILAALLFLYLQYNGETVHRILVFINGLLETGEQARERFLAYGAWAPFIFMAVQIFQVLLAPLPGEASGLLGGYLFGTWMSFIYSSIALTVGSVMAFLIGRFLGKFLPESLQRTKTYEKFNHLVCRSDFSIPFLLYIFPGFPKDSLSYILGMSRMPLSALLLTSAVGRMPGTLMLSVQGNEAYERDFFTLAILLFISGVVTVLCYIYRKRMLDLLNHLGQFSTDEVDRQPGEES